MELGVWCQDYARQRYLRERPDIALKKRLDDLVANIWSADTTGRVVPTRDDDNRRWFLRLIYHTLLEQRTREKDSNVSLDETALIAASSAAYHPLVLKEPVASSSNCLWKFGKRKHLLDALEKGVLQISPGSTYKGDASLTGAQRDDELEHYTVTPNRALLYELNIVDAQGNKLEGTTRNSQLFSYVSVRDFYVWCCSQRYDGRLFRAFGGDAVLMIHDRAEFSARLERAISYILPGWPQTEVQVEYYDPHERGEKKQLPRPIFDKQFTYAYQKEYRFVWRGRSAMPLKKFLVELGPLDDITTLFELA